MKRMLINPPIRWETYLAVIVGVAVAYTVSTMGIQNQVDRLRGVADRLESLTFSQDQSTSVNVHTPATGGAVDTQALADRYMDHLIKTSEDEF